MDFIEKNICTGCTACANICPKNAISMKTDDKGFKHPIIDEEKCINCDLCKKTCPALNQKKENKELEVYICYNKNENERMNSSSGGIFILLAKEILNNNGVIVGAIMDEDYVVRHKIAHNIEELQEMMTSKYVQSDLGYIFKDVKKILESSIPVLFTGTPCQIEGLKAYLKRDYENLYTQDIICHGVPSPKVWKKYLDFREKKDKEKPKNINFRNKDDGWHLFNMKFDYRNKHYKNNQTQDLYMKLFLNNLILRDSCYNCFAKKKNRVSDITLADCWGIENISPEIDDNKGISTIIIHNEKGKKLFNLIKNEIYFETGKYEDVVKYNSAMLESVKLPSMRANVFNDLDKKEIDELTKKYIPKEKILSRILRIVKRYIKGFIKILKK